MYHFSSYMKLFWRGVSSVIVGAGYAGVARARLLRRALLLNRRRRR